MSQDKLEALQKESDSLVQGLRSFCYADLVFEQQFILRRLEEKISQDLANVPESFLKNIIIYTSLKDSFFAVKWGELPSLPAESLAFSDEFNPLHTAQIINSALLNTPIDNLEEIIFQPLTQSVQVMLAEYVTPQSFMHYYLLFLRNCASLFNSTISYKVV